MSESRPQLDTKTAKQAIEDFDAGRTKTPAQILAEHERGQLRDITTALIGYHEALSSREHGNGAAHRFVDRCEDILDLHWTHTTGA